MIDHYKHLEIWNTIDLLLRSFFILVVLEICTVVILLAWGRGKMIPLSPAKISDRACASSCRPPLIESLPIYMGYVYKARGSEYEQ